MWSRFRRRTFAPRRPAVFGEQWPLVVVTTVVIVASVAVVIWVLIR